MLLPSLHCRILLSNWLVGYEVEKKLQLNRQDRGVHVSAYWSTCAFPFPGKFFLPCVPRSLFDMQGLCVHSDCSARSKGGNVPKRSLGPWRSSSIRQNHANIPFAIITYLCPFREAVRLYVHLVLRCLLTASVKTHSKSKTSLLDTRQMSVLFGTKWLLTSFKIFLSLSAMDGCLTAPTPLTLNQFVRQIKSSAMETCLSCSCLHFSGGGGGGGGDKLGPRYIPAATRMRSSPLGQSCSFYRMGLRWVNNILHTGAEKDIK